MSSYEDERADDNSNHHRRRFLQGVGAVGVAGVLAGCTGSGDDDDENGDDTGNGNGNGNGNGGDPASFSVADLQASEDTVVRGDTVTLTATIENTGDEDGTQTITVTHDGEEINSTDLELSGGSDDEVAFSVDTEDVDPDDHEYTVSTDDDDASVTVTVEPRDPFFEVSSLEPGSTDVEQGSWVEISATIANTGDSETTQDVVLTFDDEEYEVQADVTISALDSEEVAFETLDTAELELGEYDYTVETDDDESSATLELVEMSLVSAPYGLNFGGEPEEPLGEYPIVVDGLEFQDIDDADHAQQFPQLTLNGDELDEPVEWFSPPANVGTAGTQEVEGADHQGLYQTELFGHNLGFELAMENGTYDVIFHFAEVYHGEDGESGEGGEGDRVFDLMVQGDMVAEEYDIYAETGGAYIADQVVAEGVVVDDNTLTVESQSHEDFTKLSSVEIRWSDAALRAHYLLDEEVPIDETGNYDAEIVGDVETGAEGVVGNAYQFNGGNLALPEFGIDGGGASFSMWFNADELESDDASLGYRCLTFWGDDAPQFEVNITTSGHFSVYYWDGGSELGLGDLSDEDDHPEGIEIVEDAFPIETGEWYHCVMVYDDDGGIWSMYLNGEEVVRHESQIGDIGFDGTDNTIGDHHDTPLGRYFEGRLDDVRYYSSALTPEHVEGLYEMGDQ